MQLKCSHFLQYCRSLVRIDVSNNSYTVIWVLMWKIVNAWCEQERQVHLLSPQHFSRGRVRFHKTSLQHHALMYDIHIHRIIHTPHKHLLGRKQTLNMIHNIIRHHAIALCTTVCMMRVRLTWLSSLRNISSTICTTPLLRSTAALSLCAIWPMRLRQYFSRCRLTLAAEARARWQSGQFGRSSATTSISTSSSSGLSASPYNERKYLQHKNNVEQNFQHSYFRESSSLNCGAPPSFTVIVKRMSTNS